MKIVESVMSEIDFLVKEYKTFCKKTNKVPTVRSCVDYIMNNSDIVNQENDLEPELLDIIKHILNEEEIEEAKKICQAFGYKVIKEAEELTTREEVVEDEEEYDPLEDEPEEVKTMVRELAEYTGNDYSDAEVHYNRGSDGAATQVDFGRQEYFCYESFDDAKQSAIDQEKDLLEYDTGIEGINFGYIGGLEKYVDVDWFEDAQKEDAEAYVTDIHQSEPERYEEEFGDLDEDEAIEKFLEDHDEEPIEWFIGQYGKNSFENAVKKNNLVDYEKLAEAIVRTDGVGSIIAGYDGEEISLDSGYYCYRVN